MREVASSVHSANLLGKWMSTSHAEFRKSRRPRRMALANAGILCVYVARRCRQGVVEIILQLDAARKCVRFYLAHVGGRTNDPGYHEQQASVASAMSVATVHLS